MAGDSSAGSWVSFLSDYGLEDAFVGVCKGVMARIAPQVRVLDVCHHVLAQDVEHGAVTLGAAAPYLPTGVLLALVDPFSPVPVRGIAVQTGSGSICVGPDNGVTSTAWDALGGALAAHELSDRELWLPNPSRTFRGRDVFSPVAAHLAAGTAIERVGPQIPLDSLTRLTPRPPEVNDDHVHGEVAAVDHFGNLTLNMRRSDLEAAGITLGDTVELRCSGRELQVPFTLTYGQVPPGRVAVCEDSFRSITVAVNLGHASQVLRVRRGDPIVINRVPQGPTPALPPVTMFDGPPSLSTP